VGEPQVVGHGPAPHGDEDDVGVEDLLVAQVQAYAVVGALGRGHADAGASGDAALAEGAREGGGGGFVLARQQPGEGLDDRDLDPEGPPHGGELAADDAATDHHGPRRDPVESQRVVGGEDAFAVDLEARHAAGTRAGGQHEVLAGHPAVTDLDGARTDETSLALEDGDPAPADQARQTLVEAVDHAVLVGVERRDVDPVEARADPDVRTLPSGVGDLGGVQQRLGGDATDVQAGAAELVLLD